MLATLLLSLAIAQAYEFDIDCGPDHTVEFAPINITPCYNLDARLDVINQCEQTGSCTLDNEMIETPTCFDYLTNFGSNIYQCRPSNFEDIIDEEQNEITLSFADAFATCDLDISSTFEEWLIAKSLSGPKILSHNYQRPGFEERKNWRRISTQISLQQWNNVKILAESLGTDYCKYEDVLAIVPKKPEHTRNGVIMLVRISNSNLPVGLIAAHATNDLDTNQQAIKVFLRSRAVTAVISPLWRACSKEWDPCRPDERTISDSAHSIETSFFQAIVGVADAFPNVSHIEFHRCGGCGTMRIGRTLHGMASRPNAFVRAFVKSANDNIAQHLSSKAKEAGFYVTMPTGIVDTVLSESANKHFQSATESPKELSYFTRTNVNGRYLQNYPYICANNSILVEATEDTGRYLHVEQAGGASIVAVSQWANAINALENTVFVQEHATIWPSQIVIPTASPTAQPTTIPTQPPSSLPTSLPTVEYQTTASVNGNNTVIIAVIVTVAVVIIIGVSLLYCYCRK